MSEKVIIIGGGIAGLTAGVYAQLAGLTAAIYEKNALVGGECTGWDRQGFHIDNCIHWMMGCTPGTALHQLWRTVGALDDTVEVLRSERMYTSELDGQRLSLWQDAARTKQEMLALSPADAPEIERLLAAVELARTVTIPAEKPPELLGPGDLLKMAATMKGALRLFKQFAGQDTRDLAARFQHPLIRCLLADFCPPDSQAQSFPMAYGNFVAGDGGIPRGGSRALAQRMRRRFEELGGQVFTGCEAARLETAAGRGRELVLADGRRVAGDWFICAGDPSYTFGQLLERAYIDPVLQKMYDDPQGYRLYGMFQAAYAVDSAEDALRGEWMLDWEPPAELPWLSPRLSVKNYAYEPSFAPPGQQIVQVLLGMDIAAYDYWRQLYAERAAYQAQKERLAGLLQARIEARFPAYQGRLRLLDSWTPVTYERYCHAYKGYNQSFTPTKYSDPKMQPSAYIKGLDNVLLAGQWLAPPGGLPGAAIQGKYAVQRLLHLAGRKYKF